MALFNTTFTGKLGRDAEVVTTKDEGKIVRISVATHHWNRRTNKEETVWVNVALSGPRAISMAKHMTSGRFITVGGNLTIASYNDRQGVKQLGFDLWGSSFDLAPANTGNTPAPDADTQGDSDGSDAQVPF